MLSKVAVVGAGSWGTAVAALASRTAPTMLWARRAELASEIDRDHTSSTYLPGFSLPASLRATCSIAEAVGGADLIVMAVPSHGFRAVLRMLQPFVGESSPVLSLAKGVEEGTHARMTEIVGEVLPGHPVAVLTGPNLAREVLDGSPAATVVASHDPLLGRHLQDLLSSEAFRVYTNPDVVGCEVAGAAKNVVAIAAGICSGLGMGDNSLAALITRGLAELARLGVALGGNPLTFSGLAGMGDLVATCISPQSRNRFVGEQLGRGRAISDVVAEMKMVAEGVKSCRAVVALARRHAVEMPIAEQVVAVVDGGVAAADVVPALMGRESKAELHGMSS